MGRVVIVDAMNVIGAGAGGWWRDRPGAQRRLLELLAGLAGEDAGVVVVFEGAPVVELPEGDVRGVGVRWARRRGRDAADDRIVEEAAGAVGAGDEVTVVTADRALAGRVREVGGVVVGPRRLEEAVRG